MEVCTDGAGPAPCGRADRVVVLLRRVGVVVGVLFGLGLIAVVVADRAAAEEQDGAADSTSENEVLTDLSAPIADDVIAPVARTLEPVAPVVRAVAEPVAPLVEPVTAPVLELAAPVTEPLAPVLAAAGPVVAPVADATGLDGTTDAPAGEATRPAPVHRAPPAPVVGPEPDPKWSAPVTVPRAVAAVPDHAGSQVAPSVPSPVPSPVPGGPVHHVVIGGGTAGGHSAGDGVVSSAGGASQNRESSGLSPPGTITGAGRFAYDDRDHPR